MRQLRWYNQNPVETVVQLSKGNISSQNVRVEFSLEDMDMSRFQQGATYEEIQEWVQEKYGFHVTHLNIAKTKRKCGIIERINYNLPKSENSKSPVTPKDKEDVLFVVYTERIQVNDSGIATEVTRIISARSATSFERGLYYGKC